jgi:hypothetical protein
MPVLKNPKWERLAQELAQNKTATEAMQLAGYSDPRNSTRLTKKDVIRRRVEELQSRGAERAEVSVASLLQELEAAREKASDLDQLSAAVRAIEAKAKVSGLLVQKVEVGSVGDFDGCRTPEAVAAQMARDMSGKELPPEELEGFARLVIDWLERGDKAMREYLASCTAQPVHPIAVERIERRRLGLTHGNGSQRRITNGGQR